MSTVFFARGTLAPYDPHHGLPYTVEPIQKYLSVTFDTLFKDTTSGAAVSRSLFVNNPGLVTIEWVDETTSTIYMNQGVQYIVKAYAIKSAGTTVAQEDIFWGY